MKRQGFLIALAGAVALWGSALAPSAQATSTNAQSAAAACQQRVGWITAAGDHAPVFGNTQNVFAPGSVRLSTTFHYMPHSTGGQVEGWVVQGDVLSWRSYWTDPDGQIDHGWPDETRPIGRGWTNYTALEVSDYSEGAINRPQHTIAYGLRKDGTLFRWNIVGSTWVRAGSATGYASVKSMALISKTRTYDTFLANTRGGALYTIHIPVGSPMKPIVKPVRTRTWQGFETLIASKCGNYGTLLLGIDKDTMTGYKYAVGHANGTATVIRGLGKVQGQFNDPVYFRWAVPGLDPLNGE